MGAKIAMFWVFLSIQIKIIIIVQERLNDMGFLFGWCFVERAD